MTLPAVSRIVLYLRRKIQRLILRCKVVPDDLVELQLRTDIPVCYVLEYSWTRLAGGTGFPMPRTGWN